MDKVAIVSGCLVLVVAINAVFDFAATFLVRFLWGYFAPASLPPFWTTFWIIVAATILLTWIGSLLRGGK